MPDSKKIRIVLVDDHKMIMEGIASLLVNEKEIELAGTAINGNELFHILDKEKVDLVLLDIFLPKPDGIEILKTITKNYPSIKVILLTGNDEEVLISSAFHEGGRGYLSKSIEKEELLKAIKSVMEGNYYVSKSLEKLFADKFLDNTINGNKFPRHKHLALTESQNEILISLTEGLSFKEVAEKQNISVRAVENHKKNILEKLELDNTIDLVKFAIKNKLIEL